MKKSSLTGLAALTLFALFALCTLSLLLSGAGVYRRLVETGERSYAARTGSQYIGTKLRQSAGDITVEPFGDGDGLVLREEIDGAMYTTRIYCHENWLMELFSDAEAGLTPDDGERLLPAQRLTATCADGMLQVGLTDRFGRHSPLFFALRTRKEGSYGQ